MRDLGPLPPDEASNSRVKVMEEEKAFLATSQQAETKGFHTNPVLPGVTHTMLIWGFTRSNFSYSQVDTRIIINSCSNQFSWCDSEVGRKPWGMPGIPGSCKHKRGNWLEGCTARMFFLSKAAFVCCVECKAQGREARGKHREPVLLL